MSYEPLQYDQDLDDSDVEDVFTPQVQASIQTARNVLTELDSIYNKTRRSRKLDPSKQLKLLAKKYTPQGNFDFFARLQIVRALVDLLSDNWPHDFFEAIKNVHFMEKNSSGESMCFFGDIVVPSDISKRYAKSTFQALLHEYTQVHPFRVFVKMVKSYVEKDQFREIEPLLYETIINPMVFNRLTPHVMMYVCKGTSRLMIDTDTDKMFMFDNEYPIFERSQFRSPVQKIYAQLDRTYEDTSLYEDKSYAEYHTLVLECGKGITLENFMQQLNSLSKQTPQYRAMIKELVIILFQVFYTLCVFDFKQLTHYDLHLGNVFLQSEPAYQSSPSDVYLINTSEAVIPRPISHSVRIFDWDYSYHKPTNETFAKDQTRSVFSCPNQGICNVHNPGFDLHRFLMKLLVPYQTSLPKTLTRILLGAYVNRHSNDPNVNLLMRQDLVHQGGAKGFDESILCHLEQFPHGYGCKGAWKKPKDALLSPQQFLRHYVDRMVQSRYASCIRALDLQKKNMYLFDERYAPLSNSDESSRYWDTRVFAIQEEIRQTVRNRLAQGFVHVSFQNKIMPQ